MEKKVYNGWRPRRVLFPPTDDFPRGPVIPATRFFDNMSYIGNEIVGCFVIQTSAGLIQIDCMDRGGDFEKILEEGYSNLGLDLKDLKALLITHGHTDHYGFADKLRQKYGCKLYMSAVDEIYAKDPTGPYEVPDPMNYDMDGYLDDMCYFTLGDTKILAVATPGHTPGCLSFIMPVTDEGRPHKVALWGGTGIPRLLKDQVKYLSSCGHFAAVCKAEGVDAEVSNHPFVDNIKERLAVCRNIVDGTANPFVIGEDAVQRYIDIFRKLCLDGMPVPM